MTVSETTAERATWGSLLAVREYRYLWLSYAISLAGDQLARVAIAVLVFNQTHSALLTGVVYATTFLPWLVGGPLLSGVADRHPRRTVMMACHLLAALLADVLTDDRYVLASALNNMTFQLAQVVGFVTGGALVAVIGARPALAADATTFLLSAALVRYAVRPRPAARNSDGGEGGMALWWGQMLAGIRLVFGDPWL